MISGITLRRKQAGGAADGVTALARYAGSNRRRRYLELEVLAVTGPGIRVGRHDARFDLDLADVAVAQVLDGQLVAFLDPLHEVEQAVIRFLRHPLLGPDTLPERASQRVLPA